MTPRRWLCTREVQKTIQQSVHQLLSDQVTALGLGDHYQILQNEIRGKNGSAFYFAGLSDQTAASLKSYEGLDGVWIEEGQDTTNRSLDILIPTIRKEGSEIWITYNPQLESDPIHARFTLNPPPDCVNVEMNYTDNQWFPAVLEKERQFAQKTMKPEVYAHIWEGKCKPAVEGAIYFDQMAQAEKRIGNCPHDPLLKTHAVWDLGFNDSMSIILAQKLSSEIRIIHYIEGTQRTLADYSAELKALRLDDQPINWGRMYLPHDGFAKRHQTGKADNEVLKGLGWEVPGTSLHPGIPNMPVETGIKRARDAFSRVYFNKERTTRLVECLKRYRRQVSVATNEPGNPVHDQYSHGADAFRYLAVVSDELKNEDVNFSKAIKYPKQGIV